MNDNTVPSLFDTLVPKPRTGEPLVAEGDCGIVLRLDGRVEVFSTDVEGLNQDPQLWGEKELKQYEIGRKLMAISVALQNEQLMSILFDVAEGLIEPESARYALAQ